MNYEFNYKIEPIDILLMTLKGIYSSIVGVVNVVFTVASIGMLLTFGGSLNIILDIVLVVAILWFPLVQPFLLYKKAKKSLSSFTENIKIMFEQNGIVINFNETISNIPWSNVVRVSKNNRAIVVYVTQKEGYILTKKVVGEQFDELHKFIIEKTK